MEIIDPGHSRTMGVILNNRRSSPLPFPLAEALRDLISGICTYLSADEILIVASEITNPNQITRDDCQGVGRAASGTFFPFL